MSPSSPSIQSFFSPSKPTGVSKPAHRSKSTLKPTTTLSSTSNSPTTLEPPTHSTAPTPHPGDGFTAAEIAAVTDPTIDETWRPSQEYEETEIADLIPGPKCVWVTGRVVNFFEMGGEGEKGKGMGIGSGRGVVRGARGCWKVVVRDEGAACTVRLWFANIEYNLHLGQLVTIWTPHISNGEHGTLSSSSAPFFMSVFPERDRSCHFMIQDKSDEGVLCKTPLGYLEGLPLPALMTLKNFSEGGYDVADGRILVCVKSIGAKKKFTNKKGLTSELVNVGVFDDTGEATLTLWGATAASASVWQTSNTVLLITNPGWRIERKTTISLTANTFVDVDPDIPDADWLRGFAQRLTRREHVNPPWPEGIFDFETAVESPLRVLYNLADLDEFARAAPGEKFHGYLSMIITEINIMLLYRRNMLMCNECCGVPLFSNSPVTPCKHCARPISLSLNPKLLGPLVDETGTTSTGKVFLSDRAWEQLLGRSKEELVSCSIEVLRYLEVRLRWLRVTFVFGWAALVAEDAVGRGGEGERGVGNGNAGEGIGRLWVWDVKM
ncbi:hypothetical protein K402DRAFT_370693 [Aulographum hederae CBS 113979]|uniref:Nucleic acid-binding protein n=1 Tax=Aulographum hederae CBS 113979 TaxID=1176131 RepID=A0A6G1HAA3_9PEZI|nr:hypothetical protein K402DRAFT_370693 [Aulographum hederae CBS 113979]